MPKRKEQTENEVEWNPLYNVTTELFKIVPWGEYTADSFFSICDEDDEEYFLSFAEGLYCMPGSDSLRSYIRWLHNRDDKLVQIALRSIAITHGKDGIEFKSFMPGYIPWTLSEFEVATLTKVYRHAVELLKWIDSEKPKMDFAGFESPTRRYDKVTGEWVNEVRRLRLPPPAPKLIDPPDEMTLYRISTSPQVDAQLELDVFMVTKPSTEEGYDRPFYPTLIVLADQPKNIVLDVKLLPPGKDIPEETIDILIDFIGKYGRPMSLSVQAPEVYGMLYGFCEEAKLPLKMVGFLSTVNFFKTEKGIE
ncbi:MAG: hypothetical protein LBN43_02310 [Oscillospiraceae bacterium]|nr:hypothetical protein [Oscillospiraceae bacterium]